MLLPFLFLFESFKMRQFLLEPLLPGLSMQSCSSCAFAKGAGRMTLLLLETSCCVSEVCARLCG